MHIAGGRGSRKLIWTSGAGTIYELKQETGGKWTEHVFLSLDFWDGSAPLSPVTFDAAGDLFLATLDGGKHGYGLVLEITP
jgi:hypothetical protein